MTIDTVFHPFCTEEIETEIQLLLQCPMYTQLRRRYLTEPANVHVNRSDFLSFINSESHYSQCGYFLSSCL